MRQYGGTSPMTDSVAGDSACPDLSQQKLIADLQVAQAFAKGILESVRDPFMVLDADLRVHQANQPFYQTFQLSQAETENQFFYNLCDGQWNIPDLRSRLAELLMHQTEFEDVEVIQEFPQVGCKTLLLSARLFRPACPEQFKILLCIQDMTERKQIETALRESEEMFRSIVSTAQEGVWLLDAEAKTSYVNQRMADMLGYNADEMIGCSLFDFMDEAARQDAEQNFERRRQGIQEQHDFRFRRKNGTDLWAIVSPNPMVRSDGKFLGVLGMITDITERKQAEEEMKQFTAKLEQSNQELQDFAFVASHDLQEPLRKIQAFGDRLQLKYGEALTPEGQDYLARMQRAAQRMQTLINDLLSFSRITTQAQPFVQLNLCDIVQNVLSDLEIQIQRVNAQIRLDDLPTIEADPRQMQQLFQNLISNALKFHQPNQPCIVTIRCEYLKESLSSLTDSASTSTLCQILVQDNGIGFDEKYLERIFTMFQRLHGRNEYEGTGVGLAVCRKIVERHHGYITATSTPGKGAIFIVTLPMEQPSLNTPLPAVNQT